MDAFRKLGIATIAIEVPGTGDCPASRADPKSPDRLYSSLFDWIAQQDSLDIDRVGVWSYSTGGYYGIRIAHTHPGDLIGVVSQGGGCHHIFDPEWLNNVNHLEYPMDLAGALADKFGYGTDVEAFKLEASKKFSLLKGKL
jgi:dienelactone hydrolase